MSLYQNKYNGKKILLLGRSQKFIKIFSNLFDKSNINIVPWRQCIESIDLFSQKKLNNPDLLIVCGYNYMSNLYDYEKYSKENIINPYLFIKEITGPDTTIIYIDTEDNPKFKTYSRYRFAKNALACRIFSLKPYIRVSLPVITKLNGRADIYGNFFSKFIFNSLIKIKAINTINHEDLKYIILESLDQDHVNEVLKLDGKYLHIKRTIFVDRLLRFVFG